ncbi:flagellar basal body rod protein FlgC [Fluoribacter dumoffii]|uniref:Flagellar basal-body rod protein FlgC n=1 Tax=Fluoribacter dumoffii TaxID=463 RepID=A0A377GB18_9GAMM|nr:flagellar basal body rod protein FlgC [Fluoribacter dumoffii]KTC88915.1 flagellar basal body rod protein FlgC [Fluoribacter dumoffii NY 23]MCW8385873.1 flagellar basal body rod protein FlgC [Fluoribacter dumoffii]MCW8418926.1 flagellar basal body rod protein FlgC [Fluoribacter dumoffii]MCW8453230.1 flagellar basal body rod protein FlgC [Fluoribacter dumoffii]MCW8459549.1 flagellar basal body rod protein FlgC [Fluoribacter dumoffii]
MSLKAIFNIAGSALTAETARLSTSAENMSNANVESGNASEVYKAKYPIFKAVQEHANQWMGEQISGGVQLKGTFESSSDPVKRYAPDNPIADKDGFVYTPNVNYVEEMANVISASRSYQIDVELINTTKQLMQRTLELGE